MNSFLERLAEEIVIPKRIMDEVIVINNRHLNVDHFTPEANSYFFWLDCTLFVDSVECTNFEEYLDMNYLRFRDFCLSNTGTGYYDEKLEGIFGYLSEKGWKELLRIVYESKRELSNDLVSFRDESLSRILGEINAYGRLYGLRQRRILEN